MVIRVFYTDIASQVMPDVYSRLLQSFPENINSRIERYTGEKERRLRIAGKGLLAYALKKLNLYPSVSLAGYSYSPTNQPLLKGADINFSISHSGNMVLCAVTQGREEKIGIDVEQMKPVKLDLMKFYFDPASWQEIIHAPDHTAAFYRHWTMREAAIKASGLGIEQMELSEIIAEDDTIQLRDDLYYSRILSLKYDYMVCIASGKEIGTLELSELKMEELL